MDWNLKWPILNRSFKTYLKCDFIENFLSFLPNLYSDSIAKGALKGAVNAAVVYAKHNPIDAIQIAQMGIEIAQAAGVKKEYGLAFASGFLET